eukprot:scaffold321_cov67-Phaeocystis_antarctica.AAC.5
MEEGSAAGTPPETTVAARDRPQAAAMSPKTRQHALIIYIYISVRILQLGNTRCVRILIKGFSGSVLKRCNGSVLNRATLTAKCHPTPLSGVPQLDWALGLYQLTLVVNSSQLPTRWRVENTERSEPIWIAICLVAHSLSRDSR